MATNPLVSIITPYYNAAQYLGSTISSCVKQNYSNWELILVDDGSTEDPCTDVVLHFQRRFPGRIQLLRRNNGGPSAARNEGLKIAKGEFTLFLDSDDCLHSNALSLAVSLATAENADLVFGDWENFSEEPFMTRTKISAKPRYPNDLLASVVDSLPVSSAFLSLASPLKFDEAMRVNEGVKYFLLRCLEAKKIAYLDAPLVLVRQHRSPYRISIAHDHFEPVERANLFIEFKKLLEARNAITPERTSALNQKILGSIYLLARTNRMEEADPLLEHINSQALPSHWWYKPLGLSGFIHWLGPRIGIRVFYQLARFLGRT